MKIRVSLVSNSSSASFVCYWRCLNTVGDEPMEKDQAIKTLTCEYSDDEPGDLAKELIKNTTDTSAKGTFRTDGSTSMLNDVTDVPSYLAYLMVALKIEQGFELIDFKVERDGG